MITNNLTIEQLNDLRAGALFTINAVGFRSRAEYDRACELLDEIDQRICDLEEVQS